jgi:hypothetical protein
VTGSIDLEFCCVFEFLSDQQANRLVKLSVTRTGDSGEYFVDLSRPDLTAIWLRNLALTPGHAVMSALSPSATSAMSAFAALSGVKRTSGQFRPQTAWTGVA